MFQIDTAINRYNISSNNNISNSNNNVASASLSIPALSRRSLRLGDNNNPIIITPLSEDTDQPLISPIYAEGDRYTVNTTNLHSSSSNEFEPSESNITPTSSHTLRGPLESGITTASTADGSTPPGSVFFSSNEIYSHSKSESHPLHSALSSQPLSDRLDPQTRVDSRRSSFKKAASTPMFTAVGVDPRPESSAHVHRGSKVAPFIHEPTGVEYRTSSTMPVDISKDTVKSKWHRAKVAAKVMTRLTRINNDVKIFGTTRAFVPAEAPTYVTVTTGRSTVPWYILMPSNGYRGLWNVFISTLLLYTAVIVPYTVCFIDQEDYGWFVADNVINAVFFADILVTFVSAYIDNAGVIVTEPKRIIQRYLTGWFLLDLIACIPFDVIINGSAGSTGYHNFVRLARLPRLYRLIRLTRVMKMMRVVRESSWFARFCDNFQFNSGIVRLYTFMFTVLFSLHMAGCIWFLMAKLNDFTADTWVYRAGLLDADNYSLYLASIYWAASTLFTIGYGDISAHTNEEKLIAIIWMSFGAGFYSFTVSTLSSVIVNMDTRATSLQQKLAVINTFVKDAKIPPQLRDRLARSIEYNHHHNILKWADRHSILSELPTNLRCEVAMVMHSGVINKIPFFAKRNAMFVATVVPLLQPVSVQEKDFVYQEGDHPDDMFFIAKGRVHAVLENGVVYKTIVEGSYFGEIELLFSTYRNMTMQAAVACELLALSKRDFYRVLSEFPEVALDLKTVAQERNGRNMTAKESAIEKVERERRATGGAVRISPDNKRNRFTIKKLFRRNSAVSISLEENRSLRGSELFSSQHSEISVENRSGDVGTPRMRPVVMHQPPSVANLNTASLVSFNAQNSADPGSTVIRFTSNQEDSSPKKGNVTRSRRSSMDEGDVKFRGDAFASRRNSLTSRRNSVCSLSSVPTGPEEIWAASDKTLQTPSSVPKTSS
eukprot:GILJ01004818.1.p1 GENE.GILJ01004818.1~~GILJ01004818.1.p1  ORF type:complete len:942 (-),score=125.81 GILJ01004818.1:71-2896(-)